MVYGLIGQGELADTIRKVFKSHKKDFVLIENKKMLERLDENDMLLVLDQDSLEYLENYKINDKDAPLTVLYSRSDFTPEVKDCKSVDLLIDEGKLLFSSLDIIFNTYKSIRESNNLYQKIEGVDGKVSIFLHSNPDPDAIASAMAFEKICEDLEIPTITYHWGDIGHPENELFIQLTGHRLSSLNEDEMPIVDDDGLTVFIDFAIPGMNNPLPEDFRPDIILDHHSTNLGGKAKQYLQVNTDVGATSTMMTEHMINMGIDIDSTLASALLYGIKVDTSDYTVNFGPRDLKAVYELTKMADRTLLEIFESPPLKNETVTALGKAICSREIDDCVLTSFVGEIFHREDLPQVADILTGERDVNIVFVIGIKDESYHLCARCKDVNVHIGKVMKRTVSGIGTGGGHIHSAAGEIPKEQFDCTDQEAVEEIKAIFKREVKTV